MMEKGNGMTYDNAKLVKGLECCLDRHQAGPWASGCIQCPYAGVEKCAAALIRDAIAALKLHDSE